MKPLFEITADGENVTAQVADRLEELRILDAAGFDADTLSITLDDRNGRLALPPHQSLIKVSLGMQASGLIGQLTSGVPLTSMGTFRTDESEITGPTRRMRISATAADMSGAIRAPRTRAWEGVTLGEIVQTIAGEHGLQPVIDGALAGYAPGYQAQTAESDLNLLSRLSRRIGAVAKPVDGRLLVARRGAGLAADGKVLDPVVLSPGMASSWSWRAADRIRYGSVAASWSDLASGQVTKIVVGDGDPRRELRHVHSSEDEARRAAQSALDAARRGNETARINLSRFAPNCFAGARVQFTEQRQEWVGDWIVHRALHILNDRLVTELELERPA